MARVDIEVNEISRVTEVIAGLSDLAKNNKILEPGSPIYVSCRNVFVNIGQLDNFDPTNPKEMVKILEALPKEAIEGKIEDLPNKEAVVEEGKMEPKAFRSDELKILLDEYEQHRELKDAEKILQEARKNPLLTKVDSKKILEMILRKIELETAEVKKGKSPEQADKVSDKILVIEKELSANKPKGVNEKDLRPIAKKIVENSEKRGELGEIETKNAELLKSLAVVDKDNYVEEAAKMVERETVVRAAEEKFREKIIDTVMPETVKKSKIEKTAKNIKERLMEVKPEDVNEEKVEMVAAEIADIVQDETNLSESQKEVMATLNKAVISDRGWRKKVLDVAAVEIVKNRVEEKVLEAWPEDGDLIKAGKVSKEVAEVAVNSLTMKVAEKEIDRVLKKKVRNRQLRAEMVTIGIAGAAELEVEKEIGMAVDELLKETADLKPTEGQKVIIEKVLRTRVRNRYLDQPTKDLDEFQAIESKKEGKIVVERGKSLSKEIADILGYEATGKSTRIEMVVAKFQKGLDKQLLDGNRLNKDSPIDIVRKSDLERVVFAEMLRKGSSPAEARKAAIEISELSFPKYQTSSSAAEAKAMRVQRENGHFGGDTDSHAKSATLIRNFIRSPGKINEKMDSVLNVADKLKGVKGLDNLVSLAKTLKENPALMQSMQLIQNVARFQEWISNPIGQLFKIPALQEFGMRMATRFGGETVGAMATQIAQFGLKDGVTNILGQIFRTGTVTAVKAGATAAAEGATMVAAEGVAIGAGVSTGPPGWIVALAVMAFEVGKKVFKLATKGIEKTLDKLSLSIPEVKGWLQDVFGKGLGGLFYWGGMAAAAVLAIPMAIAAGSVAVMAMVAPMVIGGLALMQVVTAQTVSSLVPPKGMGSETGAPNPNLTPGVGNTNPVISPLPGENVPGECSVSHAVVLTKQCNPTWGSKQLNGSYCGSGNPGTICNSGCGPSSVSMLLRRISGNFTPDTIIFNQGLPFSGIYTSMGCEGSSTDQAYRALNSEFPGKVQYAAGCNPTSIAGWICAGKVVMVLASFYRNDNLETGGHFILVQAVSGGKLISADPYYDTTTPFDGTRARGYVQQIRECLTIDVGLN